MRRAPGPAFRSGAAARSGRDVGLQKQNGRPCFAGPAVVERVGQGYSAPAAFVFGMTAKLTFW